MPKIACAEFVDILLQFGRNGHSKSVRWGNIYAVFCAQCS